MSAASPRAGSPRRSASPSQYDPSLPSVLGNRDQLVQVVLNLVKNAAEAIVSGSINALVGEIVPQHRASSTASASPSPAPPSGMHLPLVISVRDNGPGIAEDIRPHLFDPFISSKPTGSGLGLALVAKIVADHGGLIEGGQPSRPHRIPPAAAHAERRTRQPN